MRKRGRDKREEETREGGREEEKEAIYCLSKKKVGLLFFELG